MQANPFQNFGTQPQTFASFGSQPQTFASFGSQPQTFASFGSQPQQTFTTPDFGSSQASFLPQSFSFGQSQPQQQQQQQSFGLNSSSFQQTPFAPQQQAAQQPGQNAFQPFSGYQSQPTMNYSQIQTPTLLGGSEAKFVPTTQDEKDSKGFPQRFYYQNISCDQRFSNISAEELRYEFLKTGKQIIPQQTGSVQPDINFQSQHQLFGGDSKNQSITSSSAQQRNSFFGSAPDQFSLGSSFGLQPQQTPSSTSPFSNPSIVQPQQSINSFGNNVFGQSSSQISGFSQPSSQSSDVFGLQSNQPSNIFGQSSGGFNQQLNQSSSIFGQSSGGFNQSNDGFNQQLNQSSNIFGSSSTINQQPGLFGQSSSGMTNSQPSIGFTQSLGTPSQPFDMFSNNSQLASSSTNFISNPVQFNSNPNPIQFGTSLSATGSSLLPSNSWGGNSSFTLPSQFSQQQQVSQVEELISSNPYGAYEHQQLVAIAQRKQQLLSETRQSQEPKSLSSIAQGVSYKPQPRFLLTRHMPKQPLRQRIDLSQDVLNREPDIRDIQLLHEENDADSPQREELSQENEVVDTFNEESNEERLPQNPFPDEYNLEPTIEQLRQMSDQQLSELPSLTIEHKKYGKITFDISMQQDRLKLADIVVGRTVCFKQGEVHVYEDTPLPQPGIGLNVPATITFYNAKPKNPKNLATYEQALRRRLGDKFTSYNRESGELKFRVQNFEEDTS